MFCQQKMEGSRPLSSSFSAKNQKLANHPSTAVHEPSAKNYQLSGLHEQEKGENWHVRGGQINITSF